MTTIEATNVTSPNAAQPGTLKETETPMQMLAQWTKGIKTPELNRLDILIDAADMLACVKVLTDAHWGYLIAITALDPHGKPATYAQDVRWKALLEAGKAQVNAAPIEVLYFFANGPQVVTLRILLPRDGATLPSICDIVSYASWYERELSEMFGLTMIKAAVTSAIEPDHLFLPDNWPDQVYPLRKDFKIEQIDSTKEADIHA